ncbi:hypothetical protein V6N13_009134 [Hibiscus sabdariffa]
MTRENLRNQIYELDPEIERTRKEIRQRARELVAHRGNNGQNPVEEQDPHAPAIRQNPPAPAEGFGGSPAENTRQHLKSFLDICNSFKIHGVSNDVLKLNFLAKFSYNNMTDNLRNQITPFRQEDDEAMHEAWEHYRHLSRCCPMQGLPKWTQVSIFYNSVNTPTRMMLDAFANGTLLDKPPREGLEILEKLA